MTLCSGAFYICWTCLLSLGTRRQIDRTSNSAVAGFEVRSAAAASAAAIPPAAKGGWNRGVACHPRFVKEVATRRRERGDNETLRSWQMD